jgi:hypothetical protein
MLLMLKRIHVLVLVLVIALVLGACGGGEEGSSAAVLTEAARIASEGLTQTAAAAPPTATNTPLPTATNTPEPTATSTNTPEGGVPTATTAQQQSSSSNRPCLRANLEYEDVPDGTRWPFDRVFTKTWRLKNTGSCTWNANFVLAYVDGELMGADSVNTITEIDVPTNEYVEISVAFQAPDEAGDHISYWMLRSDQGEYFGVGPDGKSWIWVEIESFDPELE